MWNLRFFPFLDPYPIGTVFESIENLFFCMNRYYSIPIPSRYLPRKISNWIPNWRVSVSLSMRLCTLRMGILFLKDPGFRALVGLRDPFDDLCCVEGISIWSDRLCKARGSNGTGESIHKYTEKTVLFYYISIFYSISIRLVLVSDLGSVSPFFRDELLAPVLHFVSVDRGERGLGGKRILTWEKQGGQPLSNIQHGFWQCNVVGLSCRSEWIILSTEANLCLLGKRIASYKLCLGRTWISITMNFINEVVNGGVTIILFVVTNPVCVPKKRNLYIFRDLKGAWKHIRTLEWKWKRDGTPVPSEMVRSLAQKKGLIRIILTWFCFLYFFNNTGSGSSPTRIE